MPAVRRAIGPGHEVRDWTQDNASYFRAIRIEKTMVALILLLIVGVAAFNIVAMLVMVVNDKRTDIAILRTLGAAPGTVLRVFITQGLVIGWCGVAAGVTLGVLVARNVASIAPFLERVLGFRFFDADVFYITALPSELQSADVLWISGAALLLTLAATVYPSLRAAATPPADALRYQ
jgi:lipoprotein-releasing system permease protein